MKTVILLDFDRLEETIKELDLRLDMGEFLNLLKTIHEDSEIQTAYAYVCINEKLPHIKDRIIDELTRAGYIVRTIMGDNYGVNFISDCSQAITLDALRCAYENKASNVVLVSNSRKLQGLVTLLREKDVTVENVFFGSFADYDLAIKSTGFIDLDEFISDDPDDDDDPLSGDRTELRDLAASHVIIDGSEDEHSEGGSCEDSEIESEREKMGETLGKEESSSDGDLK